MGKKGKNQAPPRGGGPAASAPADGLSAAGKKVIAAGAAFVALGFIVLSRADPLGRNWASVLSPFLIVGGYALIGIGIFIPEKLPPSAPSSRP